jgi:hypothetical protein
VATSDDRDVRQGRPLVGVFLESGAHSLGAAPCFVFGIPKDAIKFGNAKEVLHLGGIGNAQHVLRFGVCSQTVGAVAAVLSPQTLENVFQPGVAS